MPHAPSSTVPLTPSAPPEAAAPFDYAEAFSRNLGWLTEAEQRRLRGARIAIAGLGGVGGVYLLTLARLGIGRFCVADFDTYALANFNRQVGAGVSSIDRPKLDVMVEMALEINPELEIRRFPEGIQATEFDAFLEGVDVYLDGLDFFALDVRAALFARCAQAGIPATTVAPLGMGAALLNFLPGRMTFEEYFGFEGQTADERALRFLTGLSPSMLQLPYLVDPSRVDLAARRGPSTVIGVQLCAAVAAGQVVKLLLGRGDVVAAPRGLHFDVYRNQLKTTWRPGGWRHPIQRLMRRIARSRLSAGAASAPTKVEAGATPPCADRDAAWAEIRRAALQAPSADNRNAATLVRRAGGADLRVEPAALDAQPHERWLRLVAAGAMAENMQLRAAETGHPLRPAADLGPPGDGCVASFDWQCEPGGAAPSPDDRAMAAAIDRRRTNRRFYRAEPAVPDVLRRIAAAAGDVPGAELMWFDTAPSRRRALALLRRAEAERFRRAELHRELFGAIRFDIGWRRSTSDGLPPAALEVERPMQALFAALRHPGLMRLASRFGAASLLALRAAYLPARSAPHLAAILVRGIDGDAAALLAGRALERVWLMATACGLELQPYAAAGAQLRMRPHAAWIPEEAQRRLIATTLGLTGVGAASELHILVRIGYAPPPTVQALRTKPF